MADITDPAAELADIAERLAKGASQPGDRFLASQFGVEPWTNEFVLILSCIYQRIDLVARIVQQREDVDDRTKATAAIALNRFRAGFSGDAFKQHWNTAGHGLTAMKDSTTPLGLLVPFVRPKVSYPKLSEEEIAEFIGLIDAYLAELAKNSDEPEFVRQAITEGLTKFRFQLQHLGWMGSGYALDAFRELMTVYGWATQHHGQSGELQSGAVLKGLGELISKITKVLDAAEAWRKRGNIVWQAYQLTSSVAAPILLLTHKNG